MKFFRGSGAFVRLVAPLAIGLVYAGTGGWSSDRWNTALVIMGLGPAAQMGKQAGYSEGYNTYNPNLHAPRRRSDPPRDPDTGRFTSGSRRPDEP